MRANRPAAPLKMTTQPLAAAIVCCPRRMAGTAARPLAVVLLIICSQATGAFGQQKPARVATGDATISGRVIDRESKRPIEGAMVTLSSFSLTDVLLVAQTGRDGGYAFEAIAAGEYRIAAAHDDYAPELALRAQPEALPLSSIRVARGQRLRGIDLALGRGASIAGRVLDARGTPVAGAPVMALSTGGLAPSAVQMPFMIRTGARGDYVVPGIAEGAYRVSASCLSLEESLEAGVTPRQTYYPGTAEAEAAGVVRVRAGETVAGIDIACPSSDIVRISGHVIRAAVDAVADVYLLSNGSAVRTVPLTDGGAFTLRLPSGRYTVCATARDGDRVEAAFATLDVSTDATDVTLALAEAATVSGRLVTADGSPRPNALFQVAAVLTDGGKAIDPVRRDRVDVSAEGTFELRGLFGERAIQVIGVPDGWEVQRILRGKTPVTTLSTSAGETIDDLTIVIARQ